jgi:hypothetical protein
MKRSERIKRWFAVMKALEAQVAQIDKIDIDNEDKLVAKEFINEAIDVVDSLLSEKYKT